MTKDKALPIEGAAIPKHKFMNKVCKKQYLPNKQNSDASQE